MATVTISKTELETLKKKASLYEILIKNIPQKEWGIEVYSPKRIKELMREDRVAPKVRVRIKKLLSRSD